MRCVWPAVQAPGGRARRPLALLAEAIDAPEITVAPELAQGRDVVQRALHELADLGDWARGVESDRKVGLQLWDRVVAQLPSPGLSVVPVLLDPRQGAPDLGQVPAPQQPRPVSVWRYFA